MDGATQEWLHSPSPQPMRDIHRQKHLHQPALGGCDCLWQRAPEPLHRLNTPGNHQTLQLMSPKIMLAGKEWHKRSEFKNCGLLIHRMRGGMSGMVYSNYGFKTFAYLLTGVRVYALEALKSVKPALCIASKTQYNCWDEFILCPCSEDGQSHTSRHPSFKGTWKLITTRERKL